MSKPGWSWSKAQWDRPIARLRLFFSLLFFRPAWRETWRLGGPRQRLWFAFRAATWFRPS